MFDIGFSELLVIGIVTLLVLGPERMPKVARTVGAWIGRMNRYVNEIQQDIAHEVKLDEFRQLQLEMHETAVKGMGFAKESAQLAEQEADHLAKMMRGIIDPDLSQGVADVARADLEPVQSLSTPMGQIPVAADLPSEPSRHPIPMTGHTERQQ